MNHPNPAPKDPQSSQSEALAPWRSPLSRAIHRNRSVPFSRYLQLATIKPDGTPANRTLVFRGFLAQSNQLMFICDRRSQKIEQIAQNPNAEACWYFTKTREQFRLSGQLTLVTTDTAPTDLRQARQQTWQKLSDSARIQFNWPQPKALRADDDAFQPAQPNDQTPTDNFCLLLLAAHSVDHLALRGDPQSRHLYKKSASASEPWQVTAINP
ncbi:MAG: Npun_F5749 family FMN-dependent PPOX-type flavoprotein [Phormidesmis sp.]